MIIALGLAYLAFGRGGGGHSPDWAGNAAYLSAEVRPDDPITADELKDIYDGEASCPDLTATQQAAEDYVATIGGGSNTTVEEQAASDYFMCGEDYAKAHAFANFGMEAAVALTPSFFDHLAEYSK